MKPRNRNGGGAPTPTPDAVTLHATAIATYLGKRIDCNSNDQWLAVPRASIELAIETAIDWLDLVDRIPLQIPNEADLPENAL